MKLNSELDVLALIEGEIREVCRAVALHVMQSMPGEVEVSRLATLRRQQSHARMCATLDDMVALISVIPAELLSNGFVQRELPLYVPRGGKDEVRVLVPGSYQYMQRAARTTGGFYTILHALHTSGHNLMYLARDPERGGELKMMASELHFFAAQAYDFYLKQLD